MHVSVRYPDLDMYDHVLGAKAGRYPAMFSIGGDETLKPADAKANRFKPVVSFIGPFELDKGENRPILTFAHVCRLCADHGNCRLQRCIRPSRKDVTSTYTAHAAFFFATHAQHSGRNPGTGHVFAMEQSVKNATITIQVSG